MEVEANAITHAASDNLHIGTIRLKAVNGGMCVFIDFAAIAGGTYRYVKAVVGAESEKLPTMMLVIRQAKGVC